MTERAEKKSPDPEKPDRADHLRDLFADLIDLGRAQGKCLKQLTDLREKQNKIEEAIANVLILNDEIVMEIATFVGDGFLDQISDLATRLIGLFATPDKAKAWMAMPQLDLENRSVLEYLRETKDFSTIALVLNRVEKGFYI